MVDGLEKEMGERAQVIRLSVTGGIGASAARRYNVRAVPTFVVIDGSGNVLLNSAGRVSRSTLRDAIESALEIP